MLALKITIVGASTGVILPNEALAQLRVRNGGYRLTPYDRDFAARMRAAGDIMRDDREILRQLAK